MDSPLTFEEFQASKQAVDDVSYIFGDVEDGAIPGWVYGSDGGCICKDLLTGSPYLVIYNEVHDNKPIEELERILYDDFYLPEIMGVRGADVGE